jgi:uncharacterized protein (TIGR02757 family)
MLKETPQVSTEDLKALLDQSHSQYNQPSFISEDPISIPHQFSDKEDIEIAGFLTALIAWGRRPLIIRSAERMMDCMDRSPAAFVRGASDGELARLDDFVHRTFNGIDARALVLALRRVYQEAGGLEGAFCEGVKKGDSDVYGGILHARAALTAAPDFPQRTHKHLANPAKGSSAKRINMFLRWMVRRDHQGVDFGLWKGISPHQLLCPLDVHTGNVARSLGLLQRKQNDWKAVIELTEKLRAFCPEDPVKYDFSLFGLGVYGKI